MALKSSKRKVALVTGASRGIGKSIAMGLASQNIDIVFNYLRGHQAAKDIEKEIVSNGVQCVKIRANLADPPKIKLMFKQIREEFGKLDVLINNAASGVHRPGLDLTEKHWDWTMDVNTKAPWLCIKEAVPLMARGGKIVNITSLGSQKVLPYYTAIGISKAGIEALTRYMAIELAPIGISVNAVSGGYVDTAALRSFPNASEMLKKLNDGPVGRKLTANDIRDAVLFLCSDKADMIRGQVIVVDGGLSLIS